MKYSRIFTALNGETSVEELETELSNIEFVNDSQKVAIKDFGQAKNFKFCLLPKGWEGGWHNSPVKQFVMGINGEIKMTCSENSVVTLAVGNIVLLEDITGQGHHTEVTSNEDWQGVLVQL